MAQQVDGAAMPLDTEKVGIKGYLAFFLTIIFFSGVFSGSEGWWRVFDFTVLNGSFGHVTGTQTFRGAGGTGAKDGFLFALELAPSVILSLGIIAITDGLGGLRAAQQLMTPILKPLLGIPGICSLALIANLQNTDAAAGMTKELAQEGEITERDKVIFAAWQTSGALLSPTISPPALRYSPFWERQSSFRWWSFCYSNLSAQTFCASGLTSKNAVTLRKEPNHDDSGT